MNFIYVNQPKEEINEKKDYRSEIRNLYSCEKKSLNKRMY